MTRDVRNLDLDGVNILLDWAAAEGWNPGLGDAKAFHAADPKGFFGAFVDGLMVAGISAVAYDDAFGFIGLYICHPDWRGQGHGKAVWDAGMAYLGSRTIGLDGVPEQQANYARMGFVGAYETVRMSGDLGGPARDAQSLDLAAIQQFDRRVFPARRDRFLACWVSPPNQCISLTRDDAVAAYAVKRPCHDGFKLGPLFAETLDDAICLLEQQSGPVHIDVPAGQRAWMAHLAGLGFTSGFTTRRMYRGPMPSRDIHQILGVTSLELG